MARNITAHNGAYCPVPSPALLAHRLRSGKYILSPLGLEKHCPRCDDYWPADTEFFSPSSEVDGLHTWCKACYLERKQQRKEVA